MNNVVLIARRELSSFLLSSLGYWVVAAVLCLHGVWFNAIVMQGEKPSSQVVEGFFFHSSGFVATIAVLISMRLFAEEKQNGTIVLLQTSPASEVEVVLGKFFGALAFLCGYLALTFFMPLLVLVNGKISGGHLVAGYVGLVLLGGAILAIGTFASSLVSSQLLAAVLGGVFAMFLFAAWMVARKVDGPLGDVIGYLDVMDKHYRSFSRGIIKLSSVTYYLSLTWTALLAATLVLASRRWRG